MNQRGFTHVAVIAAVLAVIAGSAYLVISSNSSPKDEVPASDENTVTIAKEEVSPSQMNDIFRLKTGVSSFAANNNGKLPKNDANISEVFEGANLQTYGVANIKLYEFPNFVDEVPGGAVHVVIGAACGLSGNKTVLENGGSRSYAIIAGSGDFFICE